MIDHWLWRRHGAILSIAVVMLVIFVMQMVLADGLFIDWMLVPKRIDDLWGALQVGALTTDRVQALATMWSCAFLHAGLDHILFNLLYLWIFSTAVTQLIGQRWTMGVFLFTALTASLVHVLMNQGSSVPMLGASGTVMGFEGAYLGLALRWKLPNSEVWPVTRQIEPWQLGLIALVGAFFDFSNLLSNEVHEVAYGAHLGGFLGGLLLTTLVVRKIRPTRSHC